MINLVCLSLSFSRTEFSKLLGGEGGWGSGVEGQLINTLNTYSPAGSVSESMKEI